MNELVSNYGEKLAKKMQYIDNMKWVAKQAWAGKTVINIGVDLQRMANPKRYLDSFKTCRGELFWYRMVMVGKTVAFWSHRIYRLIKELVQ